MTRGTRIAVLVIGVVLLSGLAWGTIAVVENWIFRGELPHGTWWQFLLAIVIIGVASLAFEALGEGIGHLFGINKPDTPKWKEYLGVVTIVGVAIGILVIFNLVRG